MRPKTAVPLTLAVLGVALFVAGLLIGGPDVIEGAYFNRAVGQPAGEAVFSKFGSGLFSPSDGNLWIGAGLAFAAVALAALVYLRRSDPR